MLLMILTNNLKQIETYTCHKADILLLQDSVFVANNIEAMFPDSAVYVLESDLLACGCSIPNTCIVIDDKKWVELCASHTPVVTVQ